MLGSDDRITNMDSWVSSSLKNEEPFNNGNNDSYIAPKGEKQPKKSYAAFENDESNNTALTNSEECILSRFRNNNMKGEKSGIFLNDDIDEGKETPIGNDRLSYLLSNALNKVELCVSKELKEKIHKNYLLEKEAKLVGINDLKDFCFSHTEKNTNDETRTIEDPVLAKKERLYRNRVESIEKLLNGRFDSKLSTKLNDKKENLELKAIEEPPTGKDVERKTPQKLKEKKNLTDVDGPKRRKGSNIEPNEPGEGKGNHKKRKTTKISPLEEPERSQKLKRKSTNVPSKDLHSSYMNELANLNEYKALLNKQLGKKFEGKKKKDSKRTMAEKLIHSPADEVAKKPEQKPKVKKALLDQNKIERSEQEVLFNHFLTAIIRMVFKGDQKLSKPSLNLVAAFISEILEHLCLHATLAMQIKGHNSITKADLLSSIRASFPQVLIEKVAKPKAKKIEA